MEVALAVGPRSSTAPHDIAASAKQLAATQTKMLRTAIRHRERPISSEYLKQAPTIMSGNIKVSAFACCKTKSL